MKKLYLLLLPCLLLAVACNRGLTIEQPEITHNFSTNNLVLERIVRTSEATRLDLTVCCLPGSRFSISPETHLKSSKGEKTYALIGAEGVEIGKKMQSDSTGLTAVSLFFEPLADDEEQIDFIESEEWQLLGINPVPAKETGQNRMPHRRDGLRPPPKHGHLAQQPRRGVQPVQKKGISSSPYATENSHTGCIPTPARSMGSASTTSG